MPGEVTIHKCLISLYFLKIFEGEIKQNLVFYSDFKHIAVILVPPRNWKTRPIEE
jgi:hypothetical protein